VKLKFLRLEVVTVLTPVLCHHRCAGNTGDYPEENCGIFHEKREWSDSEGVHAYKRLPECIAKATERYVPELPKVGDRYIFKNTGTEHSLAEVQTVEDNEDEWQARLDPPLTGPYYQWHWLMQRYLRKVP